MKATGGRSDLSWALSTNKVRSLSLAVPSGPRSTLTRGSEQECLLKTPWRLGWIHYLSALQQNNTDAALQARPLWSFNGADTARHPQGHGSHSRQGGWATGHWGHQSCGQTPGSGFLLLCHSARRPKGRVGGTVTQPGMSTWTARCQGHQGRILPCASERDSYFLVLLISGCS